MFVVTMCLGLLVSCFGEGASPVPPSPTPAPAQTTRPPAVAPATAPPAATAVAKPTAVNTPGPSATPTKTVSTYTVEPGDTLRSIADKYSMTIEDIARLNDLQNPDRLNVGQQIKVTVPPGVPTPPQPAGTAAPAATTAPSSASAPVPTSTPRPAPAAGGAIYRVQPGDTLKSIAAQYGITLDALIRANNLPDPNNLDIGQEIRIPQ